MKFVFRKSLFGKLSIGLALLLALLGTIQLSLVLPRYRELLDDLDQQLYWELASDLAELLHPYYENGLKRPALEKKLREVAIVNPGVTPFILDGAGLVLVSGGINNHADGIRQSVDITPIREAIREPSPSTPLYGLHPNRRVKDPYRPFSVAEISIDGKPGYMYVMLRSHRFEKHLQFVGQRLIVGSIILGFLAITIVSVVFALLLFRYLSRHFLILTEVVEEYRLGDYERRVDVESEDEVGLLALAVNSMADQIVDDKRSRKQLIAAISHDLRSPLTSIRGFIEMLRQPDNEIDDAMKNKYLDIIHSNVLVQERLVSDLVELSKLQTAEIVPQIELSALDDLVNDVVAKYQGVAAEKAIHIEVDQPEVVPMLHFDLVLIERVLTNLLSNAIRYTGEGGMICLKTEFEEDIVTTSVIDNGPGIPEEDLPRLVETFYRVEKHRSADNNGRGLGLAIVKEILELHGSELKVESTVGVGTTFSFSLARDEVMQKTAT